MKKFRRLIDTLRTKKSSSQGSGGRGRRVKISTSSMNKNKRRLTKKKYRGQGRWNTYKQRAVAEGAGPLLYFSWQIGTNNVK